MDIQKMLLTPGAERGRSQKPFQNGKPEGVLIHYVGNPGSSAVANRNYFENGSSGNKVSAHYIVGLAGEVLQCVPENERTAHAGKSYASQYDEMAKTNNARYLGIETCHPGADGKFPDITYRALVELVADICIRHGFDPLTQVLRHYDVTGKSCPLYYVKNQGEWSKLRADIADSINRLRGAAMDNKGQNGSGTDKATNAVSESTLKAMVSLGVMNTPDYWRNQSIKYLNELLTKAAVPGVLDERINNGVTDLNIALQILQDAEVVNTPDYWREIAGLIMYTKELLINLASRARIVLEKIVHAEACGEGQDGQILVANVVLNRCMAKSFPDGIYNVVFQPGQFTPVTDGAYKRAVPSASVKKAVDSVLAGADNSQGALYFCTKASAAKGNWHERALTYLFEHRNHRFYK